jgi:ABC-type antimicrobial peptide transport system permease subunit
VLLGTFAASALLIAAVGLFGVLSYNVAQRTREFAVRTALGARPADVVSLVLKQGMMMTITGLAIGTFVSFAFMNFLSGLLYGVNSRDWVSFAGVTFVIITMAAVACVVPPSALRSILCARFDPPRCAARLNKDAAFAAAILI